MRQHVCNSACMRKNSVDPRLRKQPQDEAHDEEASLR